MKYVFFYFCALSNIAWASSKCLSPKDVSMPKVADLQIPNTKYTVGICYLDEKVKNGINESDHKDLIILKREGSYIASSETKISVTVGRISDLVFEKTTDRFVAVSYSAGEFCNGLAIFDTKLKKAAFNQGCASDSDECHVTEVNESKCYAKIECRDRGAEGNSPKRKVPIRKSVTLCK
ncbi:MAG: hypothetical protein JNL11_10170 [Bdellovibrionaceae bacterium]|nr:hypothetical protein [Pseudobdellovibrionaceae bacterium]